MLYEVITFIVERVADGTRDGVVDADGELAEVARALVRIQHFVESGNIPVAARFVDVSVFEDETRVVKALARITSYNVCYTKLLRVDRRIGVQPLHDAEQLVLGGGCGQRDLA